MRFMSTAAGVLLCLSVGAAAQAPTLTMTCNPKYLGNDLGPQVYRVEGPELVKTDPSLSAPLVMSSAVKRHPLERVVDRGSVILTSASHRVRGPVLTRTVFWTTPAGKVTKTLRETYDFRAKTIRGVTGDIERCR